MEKRELIDVKIAILDCLLDFKFHWYDVFNPLSVFRLSEHIRKFVRRYEGGPYVKEVKNDS